MKKYILISAFGMAGAICRYFIGLIFRGAFPWGTIIVNIAGCFLLPVIFILIREFGFLSEELVIALGTGFIGAFTTFSAFSVDFIKLMEPGKYTAAFLYLLLSLTGGFAAAAISVKISNYILDQYTAKDE